MPSQLQVSQQHPHASIYSIYVCSRPYCSTVSLMIRLSAAYSSFSTSACNLSLSASNSLSPSAGSLDFPLAASSLSADALPPMEGLPSSATAPAAGCRCVAFAVSSRSVRACFTSFCEPAMACGSCCVCGAVGASSCSWSAVVVVVVSMVRVLNVLSEGMASAIRERRREGEGRLSTSGLLLMRRSVTPLSFCSGLSWSTVWILLYANDSDERNSNDIKPPRLDSVHTCSICM
mmetsp:Transcript_33498/g.96774  ORF Transcript_33498/g.96774 Transcript_33498/m.96774 type:complete len:233 (-) Transcript_33498:858-1556(-)